MDGVSVRQPAVAGRFYPSSPRVLGRDLAEFLGAGFASAEKVSGAKGCVVPHAGYVYSRHVAGAVYRRLEPHSAYVMLCPNHTGRGKPLAVMSSGCWSTPLGQAVIDRELAKALCQADPDIEEDSLAHVGEHALEVQLPFLQTIQSEFRFVPITIGGSDFDLLEKLGRALASVTQDFERSIFLIASSDMNHFEPDLITRVKDEKAIEKILALNPQELYEVVQQEKISMCGYGSAVAMLTATKELGATKAELARYATSSNVVGYARYYCFLNKGLLNNLLNNASALKKQTGSYQKIGAREFREVFLGTRQKQPYRLSILFGATFAPGRKTSASLNRNERSCGLRSENLICRTFHCCGSHSFPTCCRFFLHRYCSAGRSNCCWSDISRSGWNCATNEPATGTDWSARKTKRGLARARSSWSTSR